MRSSDDTTQQKAPQDVAKGSKKKETDGDCKRSLNAIRRRANSLGCYANDIKEKEYWTDEEKQILSEWYVKERDNVIARLPMHTMEGIRLMATKMKLYTKRWTDEELEILRKWYTADLDKCVLMLQKINPKRSKQTIISKANSLGITRQYRWSKDELDILKEYYPKIGIGCREKFENKSDGSIVAMANKMGLCSPRYWSDADISILKQYYPREGLKCSRRLSSQRSDQTVMAKARNLGLKSNVTCERVMCVETQLVYESISKATKELGITGISVCLRDENRTAGGYHWKYAEEK